MIKPIVMGCLNCHTPQVYGKGMSYYEDMCMIIAKQNEIVEAINENMHAYLDQYFNSIMIDAIYTEETKTITLKKEDAVKNAAHYITDDSLNIMEVKK